MPRSIIFFLLISSLFYGCLPSPYYQKQEAIPQNQWKYDFNPKFKFEITDSAAIYHTYFIIQHTQAYPYSNLWLWLKVTGPGDKIAKRERLNVMMADPSGKWKGRGIGAVYEERVFLNISDSIKFDRKGTYEVSLEQNMRVNPLPEILHVGIRVEKIATSR